MMRWGSRYTIGRRPDSELSNRSHRQPATAQHHADLALFLSDKLFLTVRHKKKGFRVLVVLDNRVEEWILGFRV
jgi:hypothetical protein